jgi:hypothetical protein
MRINYVLCVAAILLFAACEEKKFLEEEISYIKPSSFRNTGRMLPSLILSTTPTNIDTNRYWVFNIIVSNAFLHAVQDESIAMYDSLNISDTTFKYGFYIDIHYAKTNKMATIKMPANVWDSYFDMLIKIAEEHKINNLEVNRKKLTYMKD